MEDLPNLQRFVTSVNLFCEVSILRDFAASSWTLFHRFRVSSCCLRLDRMTSTFGCDRVEKWSMTHNLNNVLVLHSSRRRLCSGRHVVLAQHLLHRGFVLGSLLHLRLVGSRASVARLRQSMEHSQLPIRVRAAELHV